MGSALYRLVLRLFPPDFRTRHAAAMAAQFDEQRRVTSGHPLARVALWLRATVDAVRHGLALRPRRRAACRAGRLPWPVPISVRRGEVSLAHRAPR